MDLKREEGKDTLENFKKSWEGEIARIRNEAIDDNGVEIIGLEFKHNRLFLEFNIAGKDGYDVTETRIELNTLESKLMVALEIARCKFRLRNRGIWARIFGGLVNKIPEKV